MSCNTSSAASPSYGSGGSTSSSGSSPSKKSLDPIFRNALRYTVSPKEYELLHNYLLSRAPEPVRRSAPKPKRFEASVKSGNEYNMATVRASIRLFLAAYGGLKGWQLISLKVLKRRQQANTATTPAPPKGATARIAASFSLMLLFHRLLHRFFTRLRSSLLESNAAAFRERNPRVAYALTSPLTPILGASLSGLFLGISPSSPLRTTIAIYVLSRSLEFSYNLLEETRLIFPSGERPSWFGSWLLMPFCYGQLLHAFVFDRDCFPAGFGEFILGRSPEYIHPRPATWPSGKPYPTTYDVVDALASLSRLRWPAFSSQILTPSVATKPAPSKALDLVRPLTGPAHPLIKHASCALLHPHDPSCARVNLKYWIRALGTNLRFVGIVYSAFALLSIRKAAAAPGPFTAKLAERIARLTVFITGAIGTSWASVCLFNALLPRGLLPSQRWFLGGALGGSWAYVARKGERGNFLYALRMSIDSAWKVGVKHRWWQPVAGGDVLVFTAALAALQVVHAARPGAVRSGVIAKGLGWTRGMEWSQGAVGEKGRKADGKEE